MENTKIEDLKMLSILLVEDDPGDQKLIKKTLSAYLDPGKLHIVDDGESALEYLNQSKQGNSEFPRPDIIFLDLNMPGMGGKEFLRLVKEDELLCSIPVVVVTTSDSEKDIFESYKLHAAGYVQKTSELDQLQRVVDKLAKYWFATSLLVKNN